MEEEDISAQGVMLYEAASGELIDKLPVDQNYIHKTGVYYAVTAARNWKDLGANT
ncbi:hypothetical protein [Kocuria marina]|uniref:hypothetical protein n=1 Tax=Kocuria marina TaxID=223184 RepID=UPI0022E30203|nr:hypothetical protein [Kocuria marina]